MANREHLGALELLVLLAVMRAGRNASGIPLARLEAKGLVESELGAPTAARGGRAKAYFRATAKGLREVRDARTTLTRLWGGLPDLEQQRG